MEGKPLGAERTKVIRSTLNTGINAFLGGYILRLLCLGESECGMASEHFYSLQPITLFHEQVNLGSCGVLWAIRTAYTVL